PANPLHELCERVGLSHACAFAVNHHACATGLLALEVAGRLLAADGDPEGLALVLAGEKAFTRDAKLVPETTIFAEGAAACLVSATGARDRMLAYAANLRGDFDDELAYDPGRYQQEYPSALADASHAAVREAGLDLDDIELILPHNVNALVWRKLCRRIGFPAERVLLENVPRFGHGFCADAFINYQTAYQGGRLKPGSRYLIAAAGAGRGATFSAMVFEHGAIRAGWLEEGDAVTAPIDADRRQRIVDHIRDLVPRLVRREIPDISEDQKLMGDLGLTSSTTLELLLELEDALEIQINVEDIDEDNAGTVGKMADYIVANRFTDE